MKRFETSMIVGLLMIGAGVLFLLTNLGVLGVLSAVLWSLVCICCGGVFLSSYINNRAHWWAAIPGCTLLGLGTLIGLDQVLPDGTGSWGGALFLGAISLGFWAVYLRTPARWWAIIPGGTLLTLAIIAGVSDRWLGADLGWLFFLGLALTFGLVYADPAAKRRRAWALYPAATLAVMAGLVVSSFGNAFDIFWPIALILAGLYLGYRAFRMQAAPAAPAAPASPPESMQQIEQMVESAVAQHEAPASDAARPSAGPEADGAIEPVEHVESA